MINRHNYEEFFLMYVDAELSATEREMVETFVQQNPDLLEELNMLQEATLIPEEAIVFTNKNLLFKHTGNEINIQNSEEKFLMYVDEELNKDDKAAVETFVLQHPQLQANFTAIKQTKLQPETIPYPNKEELYREEKKERRVIYMRFARIAVAAVLIGLGVVLYTVIPTSTPQGNPVASNKLNSNTPSAITPQKNVETPVTNTQTIALSNNNKSTIAKAKIEQNNTSFASNTTTQNANTVQSNNSNNNSVNNTVTPQTHDPVIAKNTLPIKDPDALVIPKNTTPVIDATQQTNNTNTTFAKTDPNNNVKTNPNLAQNTVYRQLDVDADDEKKSLYLGAIELNKDKLRGLIRKASKLLSKSKAPEDKDAIGTFAVNR